MTLLALASGALATNLSYSGTLLDGGKRADGRYDLQLTGYSHATGGQQLSTPVIFWNVEVDNGNIQLTQ